MSTATSPKPKTDRERMSDLAESFHVLRRAQGVRPWDARLLDRWAANCATTHAARHAAQFVLGVWNGENDEDQQCGAFDLFDALSCWDARNAAALLAWIDDPFYQ